MGKISVEKCDIEGLKIITPQVFGDSRGYFLETYNYNDFKEAGIDNVFVQDNQSSSKKGVLRGLHFQINFPQDKLVRVVRGEVYDVAVDLRPDSGRVFCFRQKTRNSSLFQRILHTDLSFYLMKQNSATSVRIFIIQMMRADFFGPIRKSALNGLFRKDLQKMTLYFQRKIPSGTELQNIKKNAG